MSRFKACIPINALQVFCCVAEKGSYCEAARALGRTSTAVIYRIARLEYMLDTLLVQAVKTNPRRRGVRTIELTETGRRLFEKCKGPLEELEKALEEKEIEG